MRKIDTNISDAVAAQDFHAGFRIKTVWIQNASKAVLTMNDADGLPLGILQSGEVISRNCDTPFLHLVFTSAGSQPTLSRIIVSEGTVPEFVIYNPIPS